MERAPRTLADAVRLLKLADLLKESVLTVVNEWAEESYPELARTGKATTNGTTRNSYSSEDTPRILPSRKLHQAQRTILGITGAVTELVVEPQSRIQELGCQYLETRALFIVTERRVPDLLDEAGEEGLEVQKLAEQTGIESHKLSRLMRCLCSLHVFRQTGPDRFANNRISAALVHNEPLRAYVLLFNLDVYTASDHLPRYLLSDKGASYDVKETAFQDALGTTKTRWDWLAERVPDKRIMPAGPGYPGVPDISNRSQRPDKDGLIGRAELEIFSLAMVGGGRIFAAAQAFDFPWAELGEGLVVDVGGGAGGFVLQLIPAYPKLKFVVQDRAEVLKQAQEEIWPTQAPDALIDGRVTFMVHDFFEPNPVKGADVYWLRGIIHDWSDSYCTRILSAIRSAMSPSSRILICEKVMNTTLGSDELESAPFPLPANYGYYTRYCHHRDLGLMSVINGIERTPEEFKAMVESAGLKIKKIWECRSMNDIVEVGL